MESTIFWDSTQCIILFATWLVSGARGSVVVEEVCYKPEGRGFDEVKEFFFFNLPNPSSRIRPLGSLSL
jgi:hypothetical protein